MYVFLSMHFALCAPAVAINSPVVAEERRPSVAKEADQSEEEEGPGRDLSLHVALLPISSYNIINITTILYTTSNNQI
jgi:hypothetical protein